GAGAQCAVEPVRPAVVSALEGLAIAARKGHLTCPMAADVVEGLQLAVQAMGHDDGLVHDHDRHEVTDPGQLLGTSHQLPRAPEDSLLLAPQYRRIGVIGRRERGCAGQRKAHRSRVYSRMEYRSHFSG